MSSRWPLACALLLAFSAGARGATLPPDDGSWIELTSSHFKLFSNAPEGRTKEVAESLERLRATLAQLKGSEAVAAPLPTWIYVFKNEASMTPYKPRLNGKPVSAIGLFQRAHDGNWVMLESRWGVDPRRIVFHEYVHFFMANNFPPQPSWYEEGIAEYFSSFEASSTEARIGRAIEPHLALLREYQLLPLDKLFAVTPDSTDYNEGSRQGLFYAESWALVHYLLEGAPERTPQLKRFLLLMQNGVETMPAFRDAFGMDPKALLYELGAYIRSSRFKYHAIRFREALAVPKETRSAPMPRAAVLSRLGELLAHVDPGRDEDAEAHFRSALLLDPAEARAKAGIGFLRLRKKHIEEGVVLLREAAAAAPADSVLQLLYGEALLQSLEGRELVVGELPPAERVTIEEARSAIKKSLELSGEYAEAHATLGRTYLVEPKEAIGPGIAELEKAYARLPTRHDVAMDLASLYDRCGDSKKRDAVLVKTLGDMAPRVIARMEAASAFRQALEEIDRLCRERKPEEAEPMLESLLARTPPDYKTALEEQLSRIHTAAVRNRAVRRYNDAISLLNAQRLEEARDAFRTLAADPEDSEVASDAKEQVERITKFLDERIRAAPRAKARSGSRPPAR
jgi:tetratricopeptide (TPR) repeat protein